MKYLYLLLLGVFFFAACEEDPTDDPVSAFPEVKIVFKAEYDGIPLVMFDDHEYGDASIQITHSDFFVNGLELIGTDGVGIKAADVQFVDFTQTNNTLEAAMTGIALDLDLIKAGNYNKLRFGIGVDSITNNTVPADYNSSSPLSNAGQYWTTWDSYVFMKHQGLYTDSIAGVEDRGWLWHIGSDLLYREVELDVSFVVEEGKQNILEITVDHKKLFDTDQGLFDILSSPENHVPVLNEAMNMMVNNYQSAFSN